MSEEYEEMATVAATGDKLPDQREKVHAMLAYITGTISKPEVVALTYPCQLLGPAIDRVGEVADQDTSS